MRVALGSAEQDLRQVADSPGVREPTPHARVALRFAESDLWSLLRARCNKEQPRRMRCGCLKDQWGSDATGSWRITYSSLGYNSIWQILVAEGDRGPSEL